MRNRERDPAAPLVSNDSQGGEVHGPEQPEETRPHVAREATGEAGEACRPGGPPTQAGTPATVSLIRRLGAHHSVSAERRLVITMSGQLTDGAPRVLEDVPHEIERTAQGQAGLTLTADLI